MVWPHEGVTSAKGGQVGIDTKKSARGKADARASAVRGGQAAAAAKRPSAAPPAAPAKKKSVPPPAVASAANDNDKAPKGKATAAAVHNPARGRLPTGSLHTEAREPAQAESLKARLTALMAAQQKLAELKRS